MTLQIKLSNGMEATISKVDKELAEHTWHASLSKRRYQAQGNWYAYRLIELPKCPDTGKRKRHKKYMHREVLERMGHDMT